MIAPIKHAEPQRNPPMIFGTISWIASELVGIRTIEQHVSEKLESGTPADKRVLLETIRDLNVRVQVLDQAIDNYVSQGRWT